MPDIPEQNQPETPSDIDKELIALIDDSEKSFRAIDLLKSCLEELKSRSLDLFNNHTSEHGADSINIELDLIELDIIRYFSESYDQIIKSNPEKSNAIGAIARLMLESENIRFSVFDRLYPNCTHCKIERFTIDNYIEIITNDLDDDESDENSFSSSKNAILHLYKERTATIIECGEIHLPAEYNSNNRKDLLSKLGSHAIDILKIAAGVAIGAEIALIINEKIQ